MDRQTAPAASRRRIRWLPFGRRRAWWRTGRQATNIAGAMEFLMSVTKRKAVCFVVSDFFDEDYLRAMQMASRKHDVIAVLITDPRELELPNVGLVDLLDPESGRDRRVRHRSAHVRQSFRRPGRCAESNNWNIASAVRRSISFTSIRPGPSSIRWLVSFVCERRGGSDDPAGMLCRRPGPGRRR